MTIPFHPNIVIDILTCSFDNL